MPQILGRNSILHILDNAGTSRNISGDLNNVVLSWTRANAVMTTFGKDTEQRIAGVRDATLTAAAIWNSDDNVIDDIMDDLLSGSTITLVKFMPGGSTAGCPLYTACMLLNQYQVTAPLAGAVAAAFTFEMANGSMSASTV